MIETNNGEMTEHFKSPAPKERPIEPWDLVKDKAVFEVLIKGPPPHPNLTVHRNGQTYYYDENDHCYAIIADYDFRKPETKTIRAHIEGASND